MMKKIFSLMIAAVMLLGMTPAVMAEDTSALDAFNALTGQHLTVNPGEKTSAEHLADIMAGVYAATPVDAVVAMEMATHLPALTQITTRDIAAFASANDYSVRQVRNAYYLALANVLRAEIMVNPASEERYRNVQMILALFLNDEGADEASRTAIRSSMTTENAVVIAREYNLPADFVAFVIMDDDWDDERWDNDDDWRDEADWDDLYEDSADELKLGDRDTATSSRIADLQERLIALGYLTGKADGIFGEKTQAALIQYQLANGLRPSGRFDFDDIDDMIDDDVVARWDYQDSFDDSIDYDNSSDVQDSPDYDNSPDVQDSPDYDNSSDVQDSPDYDNSPDVLDSPDYDNSPDVQDSPDYDNSPDVQDSPDYDNSPDVQDSPDYDNSPDVQDSPDYDNSPDVQDSPDYDNSPDVQDSPDYDNSPDMLDSPDYDNSPDVQDSPDYDDSGDDSPDYEDS